MINTEGDISDLVGKLLLEIEETEITNEIVSDMRNKISTLLEDTINFYSSNGKLEDAWIKYFLNIAISDLYVNTCGNSYDFYRLRLCLLTINKASTNQHTDLHCDHQKIA